MTFAEGGEEDGEEDGEEVVDSANCFFRKGGLED